MRLAFTYASCSRRARSWAASPSRLRRARSEMSCRQCSLEGVDIPGLDEHAGLAVAHDLVDGADTGGHQRHGACGSLGENEREASPRVGRQKISHWRYKSISLGLFGVRPL
jgi:hypothetical protein